MIDLKVVAIVQQDHYYEPSCDPKFLPLKLNLPEFDYNSENLEKVIRHVDGSVVKWDSGFPIIYKFEDDHSKAIYNMMDWDNAPMVKFNEEPSLWTWERLFNHFRVKDFEKFFAAEEKDAEIYVKKCRNINWIEWTDDELIASPVYMFNYAMKVCKGRLPDHLDNAMNMVSFKNPDSKYVKKYFKTKRYRVRSGKSLLKQKEAV